MAIFKTVSLPVVKKIATERFTFKSFTLSEINEYGKVYCCVFQNSSKKLMVTNQYLERQLDFNKLEELIGKQFTITTVNGSIVDIR